VKRLYGLKDPLRYDCDECEEPCEEDSAYCDECPYDPYKIAFEVQRDYAESPDPEWLIENVWPIVGRLFTLQTDIEILGAPMNELLEGEMDGLRILKDEQMKRHMHDQDRQSKKSEAMSRRSPGKWRGR